MSALQPRNVQVFFSVYFMMTGLHALHMLIGMALIVWLLAFGMTGLFQKYGNRPSASVRYIVDASYWIYLVHLPFTIWIPGLLAGQSWSSVSKVLVVTSATSLIGLVTYALLVRSTFVGTMLSGRRYTRGLPVMGEADQPAGPPTTGDGTNPSTLPPRKKTSLTRRLER